MMYAQKHSNIGTQLFMFFLACVSVFSFTTPVHAAEDEFGLETTGKAALGTSFGKLSPTGGVQTLIGNVIGAALSMVGVLFFILTLYGGILWMTAHGNEEQTTKAKNTIIAAVVGIIIVVASYALTQFVFRSVGAVPAPPVTPGAPVTPGTPAGGGGSGSGICEIDITANLVICNSINCGTYTEIGCNTTEIDVCCNWRSGAPSGAGGSGSALTPTTPVGACCQVTNEQGNYVVNRWMPTGNPDECAMQCTLLAPQGSTYSCQLTSRLSQRQCN